MVKRKYKPTKAFIDLDPLIYAAGFSAQKTRYYFTEHGKIVSGLLNSAKEAKTWLEDNEELGFDTEDLIRESTIETLSEDFAIKKFKEILKQYKKLAGKSVKDFRLFLTGSGHGDKVKVYKDTEHKYQYNRDNLPKPKHFKAIREYAETLDEVTISKNGFEADNLLVSLTERAGEDGVVLSIDKDMAQLEGSWFIHVDKQYKGKPLWCDPIGHLEYVPEKAKCIGSGFMFLCYQAIAGDNSDGYHGIRNFGPSKAYTLLSELTSKEEMVETLYELYLKTYGEEYTYTDWQGNEQTKDPYEMMNMHFRLAYMERSPKDVFDIMKYL